PGQLQVGREIRYWSRRNLDTAAFSGPLANYSFTVNGVAVGVAGVVAATANDIITVTDNTGADGADTIRHIERLQFSDQAIVIDGLNAAPVGQLTISDPSPAEDHPLPLSI